MLRALVFLNILRFLEAVRPGITTILADAKALLAWPDSIVTAVQQLASHVSQPHCLYGSQDIQTLWPRHFHTTSKNLKKDRKKTVHVSGTPVQLSAGPVQVSVW